MAELSPSVIEQEELDIEDWNEASIETPFYLVEEPDGRGGGLKAKKEMVQGRHVWKRSSVSSSFHKYLAIDLCAHGKSEHNENLSLIIWHFKLYAKPKHKYESVTIRMSFETKDGGSPPEIIGWGPCKRPVRSDRTEADVKTKWKTGASVGIDAPYASAEVSVERESEIKHMQRYFKNAWSKAETDSRQKYDISSSVMWMFSENASQNDGIEPDFHLAALVKPRVDQDGKPMRFRCNLETDLNAGRWDNFTRISVDRYINPDPIVLFDPSTPMDPHDTGKLIYAEVKENLNRLDVYANDETKLTKLLLKAGDRMP